MSVSIKSTAADQTWRGTSGLLGIGSIPGVTGKGIGVAVVDSGISPHTALANKVVANVSFVTGDPSVPTRSATARTSPASSPAAAAAASA